MPPRALYDIDSFNYDKPLFDLQEIRRVNPQRHEMEQLTGIVHVDEENHGIVGFKDVTDKEFWTTGHMPGFPLMPGVILCEAAAQLAGFYAQKYGIMGGDYVGFGGMNDVRFRVPVFPNCRLVLLAQAGKIRPNRRAEFQFQGFVNGQMVFSGSMIGVPINREHEIKK
ncbi:MAG: beta-hydroxyacyl-ACP dehydratase [Planctomycetaceae bacterium]|nr:beta-hydroxyacyl-ACP dehydratase [Planctomycetaceae bacterium]